MINSFFYQIIYQKQFFLSNQVQSNFSSWVMSLNNTLVIILCSFSFNNTDILKLIETNEMFRGSYVILDPLGRFFLNSKNYIDTVVLFLKLTL